MTSSTLIALFIWVYVGAEVTIGGERSLLKFAVAVPLPDTSPVVSSNSETTYTLGRVVLLWVNKKAMIYIYCLLAIGLELVVWLVPDIIGDALAVSFVGLLLGPMYPIAMNITSNIVPRR
ncbi:hypothetical protein RSAG8_12716, partial [Rhizoctonia solani AG-8 WAC10335]